MARQRRNNVLTANPRPGDEPIQDLPTDFARQTNKGVRDDLRRDKPSEGLSDDTVLKNVREFRREAKDAKKTRMEKNKRNQMAFMDQQDFSHKQPGQSTEFLPKVSVSAEQFSAFIKRALTQFGDWFSIELNENLPPFMTDGQIRNLLTMYLHNLPEGSNKTAKFETRVSDAAKAALFDSLIILKIHGKPIHKNKYTVERGAPIIDMQTRNVTEGEPELNIHPVPTWRLCIDLVRAEDYFPDPTGRGLYEIHTVERDYNDVLDMAEAGIYDIEAVQAIEEDFKRQEEEIRRPETRGQDRSEAPSFRKTIVIDEFWGTLLDEDGKAIYKNALCAIANDKYVIRKAEDNPFWHQESPFVVCPLIRVPHSVWHKALYDSACDLNIAINEMFNLMLDGGMSSVWGIKQIRHTHLDDPSQVADGIPQGVTLAVKDTLPAGEKVVETVSEGTVPTDAMAVFEMLSRHFTEAALTNDIKLGSLPARQVKATEVVEASQSQAVTLDSISADLENDLMEPALRKAWLTVLQHIEDFDNREIVQCIGARAAYWLIGTKPAERFAMFANVASFRVNGLSTTLARVRDFQKTMALLQVIGANPILLRAFLMNYSEQKVLKQAMKQLNINPDDLARTPDQMAELPQVIAQIAILNNMMNGGGTAPQQGTGAQDGQGGFAQLGMTGDQGGMSATPGTGAEGTAQVNQEANPTTGMRGL